MTCCTPLNSITTPSPFIFLRIGPKSEPAVLKEVKNYERYHGPLDPAKLAPQ